MASALVFGCVNHFVLAGPDHVSQVAEPWRAMFTTTAALLAAIEGLATVLAFRVARANDDRVVTRRLAPTREDRYPDGARRCPAGVVRRVLTRVTLLVVVGVGCRGGRRRLGVEVRRDVALRP